MSPPAPAASAPVDPLAASVPPPPPPLPAAPGGPTIHPVSAEVVPPAAPVETSPPAADPAASTYDYNFWRRLHLNVIGGYNFETRYYPDAEPFRRAAPGYNGGHIGLQPSVSVLQPGVFDLRVGLDFRSRFLGIPRSAGSVDSSVRMFDLGLLVEANAYFHPVIGVGANATLGYTFLDSSNADVGAPFSANFGGLGGLGVGFQAYLNFWRGAFRAGAGVNMMPTGFALPAGGTNPDFQVTVAPQWSIFAGADIFQIIRNAGGNERSGAPQ